MAHPIQSGAPVRIGVPGVEARGEWVRVGFEVEGLAAPRLWFDVDAAFAAFVEDSCDAALVALLLAAMEAGRSIRLEGSVSERLIWSLRNTVIPVARRQLPFLHDIEIHAPHRKADGPTGRAVLTGLSCGVDSYSAIADHLLAAGVPEAHRITHFLFSHVGHHGYGGDLDERVWSRWERARDAATELGLPILRVFSNTPDFYPDRNDSDFNWAATLTLRNSSVPLLLQRGVRRFLFASSNEWRDIGVRPTRDMTEADPILLPALSTERIELSPVGTEHTRVRKTEQIADLPIVRRTLDVCIVEGGNCTRCKKCLRTALTLDVLGKLPAYADRFDLTEYSRRRSRFVADVLVETEDKFLLEIRDLIRARGWPVPLTARATALLLRGWRLLPAPVRRLRGGIARGEGR